VSTLEDGDGGTPMEDEFDVVAGWTHEAVQHLGPDHAIPAACRGTVGPAGLDWLARACRLGPGSRLLDVGAGLGGPAAYAAGSFDVAPLLVEPMPTAARAAARLFGLPSVVASGQALPLAPASVDAVWCLGVLCTTEEKDAVLAEIRRVLVPGGALGLYVLLSDRPHPLGAPEGNAFPSRTELAERLHRAGFTPGSARPTDEFPAAPAAWAARVEEVDAFIEHRHGNDPRFAVAQEQGRRMARLLGEGTVAGEVLHAVAG
jgi:SAM-dependent methyltransferase